MITAIAAAALFGWQIQAEKRRPHLQDNNANLFTALLNSKLFVTSYSVWILRTLYNMAMTAIQNPLPFIALLVALAIGIGLLHLKDKIKKKDDAPSLKNNLKDIL